MRIPFSTRSTARTAPSGRFSTAGTRSSPGSPLGTTLVSWPRSPTTCRRPQATSREITSAPPWKRSPATCWDPCGPNSTGRANRSTASRTRSPTMRGSVAFETDSVGTTLGLRYVWGLGTDALVAVQDAGTNEYYAVLDKLGSVRGLVKRDGTWVMSQRFGPYGATIARDTNSVTPPPVLRYGWTGREYDAETGWYFFRARYFDPAARRYVQEDPIGYGGGSNLFAYGDGGPLEGRDPNGMAMNSSVGWWKRNGWRFETPPAPFPSRSGDDFTWEYLDVVRAYDDAIWQYEEYRARAEEFIATNNLTGVRPMNLNAEYVPAVTAVRDRLEA